MSLYTIHFQIVELIYEIECSVKMLRETLHWQYIRLSWSNIKRIVLIFQQNGSGEGETPEKNSCTDPQ